MWQWWHRAAGAFVAVRRDTVTVELTIAPRVGRQANGTAPTC
jgi:sarcosine oxidase delta subunit